MCGGAGMERGLAPQRRFWHFFGCVRGSLLLFSKERSAVRRLEFLNLWPPAFLSKKFQAIAKKGNAEAKKPRDDLHGNS
jgi:hypothetical protein